MIAQTAQSYWTVPNGNLPDFRQTFSDGEALPIAWNGWDSTRTDEFLDGVTVADLWVTSYEYGDYPYAQLVTGMFKLFLPPRSYFRYLI